MEHGFRIFWSDGNILGKVCHDEKALDVSMCVVLFAYLLIRKCGYICCKDPKTTNHRQLQKNK